MLQNQIEKKGLFPSGHGGNYNVRISGPNARVNIASHNQSTNIVADSDVFGEIAAVLKASVTNAENLENLLIAVQEMKEYQGNSGFVAAYQKFVSLTADHLGLS